MIFKVDSLGETMKEIKVYLLNGLTRRRMEDKQEAWLKAASHHGSRHFCEFCCVPATAPNSVHTSAHLIPSTL